MTEEKARDAISSATYRSRIGHCHCPERGFVGPAILKLRGLEKPPKLFN